MRLQLALDGTLDDAIAVIAGAAAHAGIIEAGTPLVLREGMRAVRHLRAALPDHIVLADLKIMDAGGLEAAIGFATGADIVSVLALAHEATIAGAVAAAKAAGGRIMVDLIQAPDPPAAARRAGALGCDLFCLHRPSDDPGGRLASEGIAAVRAAAPGAEVALAGGIGPGSIAAAVAAAPDIIAIGSAITQATDPARAAAALAAHLLDHD